MSYLGSHLNKSKILLLTRLHVACEIWTLAKAQKDYYFPQDSMSNNFHTFYDTRSLLDIINE